MDAVPDQLPVRGSPVRNVTPSDVSLRVSTDLVPEVELIAWNYEGDGTFDAEGPHLQFQTVTFSKSGHFSPRVVVTNKLGQTSEATAQMIIAKPADLNHT